MRRVILLVCVVLWADSVFAQNLGFPLYGSFESGSFDSVNRQNLNTMFSIPIVSDQDRGMSFRMAISYNSLVWQNVGNAWVRVSTHGWNKWPVGTIPYTYTTGTCQYFNGQHMVTLPTYSYSGYSYVETDGTTHPFNVSYQVIPSPCPGSGTWGTTTGYATDSSGYYLNAVVGTAPVVYSPGGIQITTNEAAIVTDTNGNYISYAPNGGSETDFTDTAGHLALKIVNVNGTTTDYKYLDPTGTYQLVTWNTQAFNIKTNFGCSGISEFTGTNIQLLTSLVFPNGLTYSFSYEPTPGHSGYVTGRIQEVTLPNGGTITYTFGGSNDGINCSDGTVVNLTRAIYDGTNSATWTFTRAQNGSNWQTSVTAPQMPYDSAANQSVYTFNSSGQETSEQIYQGSSTSGTLLRTVNTTWASNGSPATRTTILEDNQTQSEVETSYDSYANLLSLKEHDYGAGGAGSILRTTTYTYLSSSPYTTANILNRVTEKTIADSTGAVKYREDYAYDGTTISPCPTGAAQHDDTNHGCTFTTRGNPTSKTTYTDAATPAGGVTKNSYHDVFGNLVKADVDCCQSESWTFSSATQYAHPDSVTTGATGGAQLTTSHTYNAYSGQIASETDPNNQKATYSYDTVRRNTILTRPDNAQVTWSYNDTQFTMTKSDPVQGTSVRARLNNTDGLGNLLKTTVQDGTGTSYAILQRQLDPLGRVYQIANPHNSTAQYWTTTQFDALGRETKVSLQDGSQITHSYSLNTMTDTDPAGHQRKYQYDGLGRMSTVFEPDPNNNNSLSLQTSYVYTVLDQKTTVTQGSQTRTSNYDGMGRLTGETTPEAGTVSYQYNSFNKMTQRTDARGVVTTYTYDTLNRLTGISYNVTNTTATATSSVSYTYGTNAAQYNNGRLVTVTDGPGSVTYTYDLLGRVTQEQQIINGNSYTIGYQYNLAGQVTSLTYPSGRVVQPSYDTIGRLTSVSTGTTTLASGVTYDPSFRVTTYTYGNGIVANLSYSSDRRQLQSMSYVSGSQTLFGESAYGHSQNGGNNGQITSITDSVDSGRNITYAYDALGRLSSAVTAGSTNYPKWGLSWTYDRYGNRMTQAVTAGTAPSNSVTVNAATNQITTSGYSYDASGNMTNDGVNAMTYDAEGRVATAADGAGTATYSYRASGLRVLKSFGSTTTVYVYVGNRALAEYANGSLSKEYTYLNNRLLASYVNGTLYYHHFDLLSTRITTDTSGNNVGGQGHYPYGEDWYETGTTTTRHFTTYERDSESANDYAIHRVYVNRLGRFSSADSVRPCGKNPQLFDRFAYVADDPVNRTDPTGLYFYVCPQGEEDPGLDCSYCNTQSTGFYDLSGGEDAICASSGGEPGGGGGGLSCAPNIIAPRNEQFHCNTQQRSTVTISGRDVLNINIFNLHVQATTDNLILLELIGTPYLSSLSNPDNIIYEQVFNVHKTEYSSGNLNWTVEYECDGPFFTVNRTTVIKSSPNSCK